MSDAVQRYPGARLLGGIYQATAYSVWYDGRLRSVHRKRSEAVAAKRLEEDEVREEPVLTDGEWYVTIRGLKVDSEGAGFTIQQRLASGRLRPQIEAQRFPGSIE